MMDYVSKARKVPCPFCGKVLALGGSRIRTHDNPKTRETCEGSRSLLEKDQSQ